MKGPLHLSDRVVDLERSSVLAHGRRTRLTALETRLLTYLLGREGEVVTRDELQRDVWRQTAITSGRAIDSAMHRLRVKLEVEPARPRHLHSLYGVGYRFDVAREVPNEGAMIADQVEATPLIGRDAVLAELTRAIAEGERLTTLTGPAGVGKTRLAWCVAQRLRASAPGTSVFACDLALARGTKDLVSWLAASLGVRAAEADGDDVEWLASWLARKNSALLVLDNAEGVALGAREALARLIAETPQARWLVTSRVALNLPGEWVHALTPLDPHDARTLFRAHARQGASDDEAALDALLARLDGLPLAIELAALRTALLSPRQILERLEARFELLRDPLGQRDERHGSLRAALDVSWELLVPGDRAVLAQCGVFQGPFTLEDSEGVIAPAESGWPTIDALQRLLAHSLVTRERAVDGGAPKRTGDAPRLRLLDSVRDYARTRLSEGGTLDETRRRHAAYYGRLAAAAVVAIDEACDRDELGRIGAMADNLRAVLEASELAPADAVRAAVALVMLYGAHGPASAARAMAARAVAIAESSDDPALAAEAFLGRSVASDLFAAKEQVRPDANRAVALARATGEPRLLARALLRQSVAGDPTDAPAATRERLLEALALYRQSAHAAGVARAECLLTVFHDRHDRDAIELLRWSRAALASYDALEGTRGHAIALHNHGAIALDLALPEARACLERARAIYQAIGYAVGHAGAERHLAVADLLAGARDSAETRLAHAIESEERSGHHRNAAWSHLVHACALIGEAPERAAVELDLAQAIAERLGDVRLLAAAHAFRALAERSRGERRAVRTRLAEGRAALAGGSDGDARRLEPLFAIVEGALDGSGDVPAGASWEARLAARLTGPRG